MVYLLFLLTSFPCHTLRILFLLVNRECWVSLTAKKTHKLSDDRVATSASSDGEGHFLCTHVVINPFTKSR
ncbi:hypothetical protein MJO28_011350 [Puccinia striiformis f. sp. tritici]|uniref:Uncharacterized protein n=1 Tax=Puccinia striiformis f. sp. tritici TaxID=168172 RepID=A0ACC0E2A0_9BASI|nr:hypothetical protein MJO28_011350 [Puccinia striiformis f. sp. tritici]